MGAGSWQRWQVAVSSKTKKKESLEKQSASQSHKFTGVKAQWKLELSWTEIFQVGLSWAEYADNLSLHQKILFFQMKSEVIYDESEWLLACFCCNLHPTMFCRTLQRLSEYGSEASYFRKYTIFYCLCSLCPSSSDPTVSTPTKRVPPSLLLVVSMSICPMP